MLYLHMRPDEIREAVKANIPVLITAGSVEYHGEHLPIGTDALIAESVARRVERRVDCVLMPAFPFSPTMSWAAGPEDGEFDFPPDALEAYAKAVFSGILAAGFRRIYVMQHHQGSEAMPWLTLRRAFELARYELVKRFPAKWGRTPMEECPEPRLFEIFKIASIDGFSDYRGAREGQCPIGHAGRGETQLMLADYERHVRMEDCQKTRPLPEWLNDAHLASKEDGEYWLDFCADGWVKELKGV